MPSQETEPVRTQIVRAVAVFALGWVAAATAIHFAIRRPLDLYAAVRSEKLEIERRWNGRATVAFFGSSHGHYGLDPRVFDRTLGENGTQTVSINLAVLGGAQTEQRAMALRFVRELRPHAEASCMVALEINAGANFTPDHLVHPRAINIYDAKTLRFVSELSEPSLGRSRELGRTVFALAAAAMHYANVGMLADAIFAPPLDDDLLAIDTANDRRGLHGPPVPAGVFEGMQNLIATSSRTMTPDREDLLPGNAALVRELRAESAVKNLEIVYWVSPKLADLVHYPEFPREIVVDGRSYPVLGGERPSEFPELYEAANWSDDAHLSEAGAAIFTRRLTQQLADWRRVHPHPATCGE